MITKVSNNENAESGLLPYPVIIVAISLRETEKEIQKDLDDGIDTIGKK